MNINIICIGKLKEKYYTDSAAEYLKRLSPYCKITVKELDEIKLPQNPNDSQIKNCIVMESKNIIKNLSKASFVVTLCIEGKQVDSNNFSQIISNTALNGKSTIDFVIGGSFGLSDEIKEKSDFKLSFSKMTFTHQMARIILLEQIYRAFQISSNGKYHK